MINDEICKLREKLNQSIINGNDYSITYQISIELDDLIAKYYSTQIKLSKNNKRNEKAKELALSQ